MYEYINAHILTEINDHVYKFSCIYLRTYK